MLVWQVLLLTEPSSCWQRSLPRNCDHTKYCQWSSSMWSAGGFVVLPLSCWLHVYSPVFQPLSDGSSWPCHARSHPHMVSACSRSTQRASLSLTIGYTYTQPCYPWTAYRVPSLTHYIFGLIYLLPQKKFFVSTVFCQKLQQRLLFIFSSKHLTYSSNPTSIS